MKKTYTKKQIQEAIAYWKKQLAKGNYRKVNEDMDGPHSQIRSDVQELLAGRNDIPNYLKNRILELISDNAGYDGIEYDDQQVNIYVNQFKRERVITLTAVKGGRKFEVNVPTATVPLKVTPNQLLGYLAKRDSAATALYCDIKFDFEVGPYRFYYDEDFNDPRLQASLPDKYYMLDLGEDGDAVQIYDPYAGNSYYVGSDGVVAD